MKISSHTAVRFSNVTDDEYRGLQYVNGVWERSIDFRLYHVAKTKHWFRKPTWAVYLFSGANTAALGGGQVYFDKVSEEFSSELEAIRHLARMEGDQ